MKTYHILTLVLTLIVFSCKETPKLNYKYAEKDKVFLCSEADMDLISEATYAFEDFILTNYDFTGAKRLGPCYRNFFNNAQKGLIPMADRADEHMIAIISALKKEEDLWIPSGDGFSLNYDSNLMTCVANTIQTQEFKNVFLAMVESKTLKGETIAPLLRRELSLLEVDKSITTYAALDLFYSKILDIDFSVPKEELLKIVGEKNKNSLGHQHQ